LASRDPKKTRIGTIEREGSTVGKQIALKIRLAPYVPPGVDMSAFGDRGVHALVRSTEKGAKIREEMSLSLKRRRRVVLGK